MSARIGMCVLVFVLVGLVPSCAKLPEWETPGDSVVEELEPADAIPSQWGKIVAVTNTPQFEFQYQLWFQDGEGRVRLVNYDIRRNRLMSTVRVINRR